MALKEPAACSDLLHTGQKRDTGRAGGLRSGQQGAGTHLFPPNGVNTLVFQ